jgi:YidC/Oxa1 family membrane protein insertase
MENQNNLLIAIVLSIIILISYNMLYEAPRKDAMQQTAFAEKLASESGAAKAPKAETAAAPVAKDRATLIAADRRVRIDTPEIEGSIRLKGARLDDVVLKNYKTSVAPDAKKIMLLSPAGSAEPNQPYYTETGWLAANMAVPTDETEWKADGDKLTPERALHLSWNNGQGLTFERTIEVDKDFLFTVTDRVKNDTANTVTLYPFGLISRHGAHPSNDQEGPLGVLGGTLKEYKFKDMASEGKKSFESDGGWLGVGDKYWLVALVPPQADKIAATFTYTQGADQDPAHGTFQSDFRSTPISVAAGASAEKQIRVFAGAKRVRLFDRYTDTLSLPHFDRAIDFGWFYFLTKPFLYLMDYLGEWLGNYGLAILALTVLLKAVTYPLSAKSYIAMAKMKDLQPEIKKIQDKYKDDQQRMAAETMALYKREKTNPMSGCLPIFIQIPIFFALYKVLSVNIELRQADFYGWIHDLSMPDPTSVWNLFGLISFQPDFLPALGVWPILMGISMYVQQILSPQPPDKNQARIFKFMPILFTFMMAQVASGLVIYWTLGNILGLLQQWTIIKHHGQKKPA